MATSNLTPKQEKFCQKYIELGNASEAYRQSYDSANMKPEVVNNKASALLAKGEIRVRLEELRKPLLETHQITVHSLIGELDEARDVGIETKNANAMISATMAKAKIAGLVIDKSELTGKDGKDLVPKQKALNLPKDATPAQWEALARGLGAIGDGEYAT